MAIFKVGSDRPSADEIREKFFKNKEEKTKLLNAPIERPMEDPALVKKASTSATPATAAKVEISPEAKAKTANQANSTTITVTVTPGANESDKTEVIKEENKEIVNSDIKKNDPNDPVTKEKLKAILSNGAFNFKPEERKALSDILGAKS
jgi:hypothetical protein